MKEVVIVRRSKQEIKSKELLEDIIRKAHVVRIAMSAENIPYIVPVNYGYKDNAFYFHCAKQGKKLDIIKINPNVAFEIDTDHELLTGDVACKFTMKFRSIIGNGVATVIENTEEKIKGLDIIMSQYSDINNFDYNSKAVDAVVIVKIDVIEMTGKQSGY